MLTLKIRPPQKTYRPSAPIAAHEAVVKFADIYGSIARLTLVDVAFSPDHPETVYVWEVTHEYGATYLWSDANGLAGIADESGAL